MVNNELVALIFFVNYITITTYAIARRFTGYQRTSTDTMKAVATYDSLGICSDGKDVTLVACFYIGGAR